MKYLTKIGVFSLVLGSSNFLMAQSGDFMNGLDSYESDQMDIDGSFQRKDTAAQRLGKYRKKLEQKNEEMVQKKIEDIRLKQESDLAGKLQKAFKGNMEAIDRVDVQQAAPRKAVVAPLPPIIMPKAKVEEKKTSKVTPYLGIKQYSGDDVDSFESNTAIGLNFDNMVTDNIAIGVGFSYSTMDIELSQNNYNGYGYYYNDDLEIKTKTLSLGLGSKYYISTGTRVMPFIAVGVAYNRISLDMDVDNTFYYNGFNNNDDSESVTSSNISGNAGAGAEIQFGESFGIVAEVNYTKAFTSGFESSRNSNSFTTINNNNNKNLLKNQGDDLENADVISLNMGLQFRF